MDAISQRTAHMLLDHLGLAQGHGIDQIIDLGQGAVADHGLDLVKLDPAPAGRI